MNTKITVDHLAVWIENLKELAKNDTENVLHWFGQTAGEPFSIVGGWCKMFHGEDYTDIFCCSASHPEYAMCIKIVENKDQLAIDFDSMPMPLGKHGEVDDTCIPLEWSDDPMYAAQFFLSEWERIMKEHSEALNYSNINIGGNCYVGAY